MVPTLDCLLLLKAAPATPTRYAWGSSVQPRPQQSQHWGVPLTCDLCLHLDAHTVRSVVLMLAMRPGLDATLAHTHCNRVEACNLHARAAF